MMSMLRDLGLLAGLLAALGVVGLVDRSWRETPPPPDLTIEETSVPAPAPEVPPLRLAVSPPQYDDMGKLLRELGSGYAFDTIALTDLEDGEKLSRFDVIFLTCGTIPDSWSMPGSLGPGARPGVKRVTLVPEVIERVKQSLRGFVGKGGTLYSSDWRLEILSMAFPELFNPSQDELGAKQKLRAEVVDPGLRDLIGPALTLNFDLPGWYPATVTDATPTVYLKGDYRTVQGDSRPSPLLVKVPYEKGSLIFTSFHNERQNSDEEKKLLRYLVFAVVTAQEVARVQQTMLQGGFSPQKVSILDVSKEQSVTQTYQNAKVGALRFVLGFAARGARFKLEVRGPDGKFFGHEGTSTFTIEVPDAPAGEWTYTITARSIPYPNFPFTLTIGK